MHLPKRFIHSLLTSPAWWAGVAISFALYLLAADMVKEKNKAHFDYKANNAQLAIQTRVRAYIDILRGTNALFYTSDHISREQFHAYVKKLQLERSFPGITNLNYAQWVTAKDKSAFESAVRRDNSLSPGGYPDFAIKPAGERAEYHVLTFLEPLENNLLSFGFDIASNAGGASAVAASRDTGQLISSGRLIRISGPHQHVGLAMRMPLYRRGMPLNTVEERRKAYYGSVGAGFDINKLMLGAIDKETLKYMRLRLYDTGQTDEQRATGTTDPSRLLFDSEAIAGDTPPGTSSSRRDNFFVKRASMTVGPRVWEAEFSSTKIAILNGFDAYLAPLVLVSGLLGSLLLYTIYYSLISAHRRAIELARDMTKDLRASQESLAEAQHMAHLGSWILEPASKTMTWSEETYRIFKADTFVNGPQLEDFLHHIHETDQTRIKEGLERCLHTGEEFDTEHRILRLDGGIRWAHSICHIGHNDQTRVLRGIIVDITERKHTLEALKRSQDLLRELTAHQDRVKEDERRRIAREIHDELGQTLLALRIDVSMLDVRTGQTHPLLNKKVRDALQHIDSTVKTIRTIINNLRPAVLDLGLAAAIEWQVNEFRRRSGIECALLMSEEEINVDDIRATTLFRILQESLTNVIRHANASNVVIELDKEDNDLVMKITDDGIGIYRDRRRAANSFGLVGVEERIHALNGKFQINSAPGKGTILTIFIPLETDSASCRDTA